MTDKTKNEVAREMTEAEKKHIAHRLNGVAEINAMRAAFEALCNLTEDGKRRAIRWLEESIHEPDRPRRGYDDEEPPF